MGWSSGRVLPVAARILILWTGIFGEVCVAAQVAAGSSQPAAAAPAKASLVAWKGLRVGEVDFQGVTFAAKDPLPGELPQQAGEPLDPAKVTASIRRLFATGRYRDIGVADPPLCWSHRSTGRPFVRC